ncbi:MAG: Rnf-Nqr domain containing protein [Candidatus Margulisiibacteriota bacterium]
MMLILQGALTQNVVLGSLLGVGVLVDLPRSVEDARREITLLGALLALATVTTWLIEHIILLPLHAQFLRIIFFMLTIALGEQALEHFFGWRISPYRKVILWSVVLGVSLQNTLYQRGFSESLFYALGAGLGYILVLVMMIGLHERLKHARVSRLLQGLPMILLCATIMSMAFTVFLSF